RLSARSRQPATERPGRLHPGAALLPRLRPGLGRERPSRARAAAGERQPSPSRPLPRQRRRLQPARLRPGLRVQARRSHGAACRRALRSVVEERKVPARKEEDMPEIDSYTPGTFCWAERGTTDGPAAKEFYGALFGWQANDIPLGDGSVYTMLQTDGKAVAALYASP